MHRIETCNANAYLGKAKVDFLLRRTKEAIDNLQKAFKLDPEIKNNFAKDYPEVKTSKLFEKLVEGKRD